MRCRWMLISLFVSSLACTKPGHDPGSDPGSAAPGSAAPGSAAPKEPRPPAPKTPPRPALPDSAFAAKGTIPASAKIPPLSLPSKLAVEASPKIFEKLVDAHYDAERLGMKGVSFGLVFSSKKSATRVEARGVWRAGAKTEIKITRVQRKGKERAAGDPTGQQIHTALTFRIRRLLDGLGNGFLSRRLAHYKGLEGKVKQLPGGKLSISFKEESGLSTVVVGAGYLVESVSNRSPKGVTRQMSYEHELDGGRNFVKRARMSVQIDDDAKLKNRTKIVLRGAHDTEFSITYAKVGPFRLPLRLVKKMPSVKDELTLELKY